MTSSFKRRTAPVSTQSMAQLEQVAATAPIVADPRVPGVPAAPVFAVGMSVDVPLERIRSNPLNPRAVYPVHAIEEMAQDLVENGQRVPATGFIDGDDIVLIEGETRLRGARFGGLKTLRVEIQERPASNLHLYKHARSANVNRRDQTPLDDAMRWADLLREGVFRDQQHIVDELKMSKTIVSRTMALTDMPQQLIKVVAEYPALMNLSMLTAIREYCTSRGLEAAIDYVPLIAKNGWGYRQVEEDAKPPAAAVTRPRADRQPITFAGAKGEIKTFEKGGRVELKFTGLSAENAELLVQRLRALTTPA